MDDKDKQPFLGHLEELRHRLIISAIAVGAGFFIAYFFSEKIFQIIVLPLKSVMPEGERLIFTSLPEMFMTYLKVSFLAGIILASPVVFYQIWMFIAPGLYREEKKLAVPFVLSSTLLFICGSLFGYFIVFPFGFKFFMGFSNDYVKALPSVREYLALSLKLLFAFGLIFELPVFIFFLAKMGIVTQDLLKRNRKYTVLIIFIVAAILTPPDVITQFLMAVPLLVLYEIGIIVAGFAKTIKIRHEDLNEENAEV